MRLSTAKMPQAMSRLLLTMLTIGLLFLAGSCDKDSDTKSPESLLYGMWVKGTHTGDTLYFTKINGVNIMRSNQSFNPGMFSPNSREYRIVNGKLELKMGDWSTIDSFTWKVTGREFEIKGHQVYMFLSSTLSIFTFRKVGI